MLSKIIATAALVTAATLAAPATAQASTYPAQAGLLRASVHSQAATVNPTAAAHRNAHASRNSACLHGYLVQCFGFTRHTR